MLRSWNGKYFQVSLWPSSHICSGELKHHYLRFKQSSKENVDCAWSLINEYLFVFCSHPCFVLQGQQGAQLEANSMEQCVLELQRQAWNCFILFWLAVRGAPRASARTICRRGDSGDPRQTDCTQQQQRHSKNGAPNWLLPGILFNSRKW